MLRHECVAPLAVENALLLDFELGVSQDTLSFQLSQLLKLGQFGAHVGGLSGRLGGLLDHGDNLRRWRRWRRRLLIDGLRVLGWRLLVLGWSLLILLFVLLLLLFGPTASLPA
jgi:hypothetical protein